jgi:hypothetical protein
MHGTKKKRKKAVKEFKCYYDSEDVISGTLDDEHLPQCDAV